MAQINITNSQGTMVYIAATASADVSTPTAIETTIGSAAELGCLQSLGDIATTRTVQEYSCMSTEDFVKSSGSLTAGNFEVSLLFDALDATGQAELRLIYAANESRTIIIQLNDTPEPALSTPTYITFEGFVSGQTISIQKDSAVLINSTIEIGGNPAITNAVVGV